MDSCGVPLCSKMKAMAVRIPQDHMSCSICYEVMVDPKVTQCGHSFCGGCIEKWLVSPANTNQACPECKKHVEPNKLITDYKFKSMVEWYMSTCGDEHHMAYRKRVLGRDSVLTDRRLAKARRIEFRTRVTTILMGEDAAQFGADVIDVDV